MNPYALGSVTAVSCPSFLTQMLSMMTLADNVVGRKSNVGSSWLSYFSLCLDAAHDGLGDMKRPTCSRCIESGWNCVYSTAKKKPGPARGARRRASEYLTFIDTRTSSPQSGLISFFFLSTSTISQLFSYTRRTLPNSDDSGASPFSTFGFHIPRRHISTSPYSHHPDTR